MKPISEKDIELITRVLPNVAAQIRSSMASVCAAANRIAPADVREADPVLDKNAAILTMSCQQIMRLTGNLSAAGELAQEGRFSLHNDNVIGLCRSLCEQTESLFSLRGVSLVFSADRADKVIAVNARMLERALLNLLSNALKFTPTGGTVTMHVKCGERFVQISVADTGCGVAEAEQARIFQRFYRCAGSAQTPGVGIGLYLTRQILSREGGYIRLDSRPGCGSSCMSPPCSSAAARWPPSF